MKRQRGHAMLELAISSAVMISCLAGTFQFGYTFYVYNQLVTAVGNGGRYAAMRTYHPQTSTKTARRFAIWWCLETRNRSRMLSRRWQISLPIRWTCIGSWMKKAPCVGQRIDSRFQRQCCVQDVHVYRAARVEFPYVGTVR